MRSTILSLRGQCLQPARCHDYEFEDILAAVTDGQIWAPVGRRYRRNRYLPRFLHKGTGPSLPADQELCFANCMTVWDLNALEKVPDWRANSRFAVCWIKELFASTEIPQRLLRVLQRFDVVVLNFEGSVESLQKQLPGTDVVHLPLGIDTLRFNPFPKAPHRGIDISWLGRHDAAGHKALFEFAEAEGLHYAFNTSYASSVSSYIEHRVQMSAALKRTQLFFVKPAKFDDAATTAGQSEIGYRYFEGMAAGATLVGQAAKAPSFAALFPWSDAVAELPAEPQALVEAVRGLLANSSDAIAERNVAHALQNHDWIYRIEALFGMLGITDPAVRSKIAARRFELAAQAQAVPRTPTQVGN